MPDTKLSNSERIRLIALARKDPLSFREGGKVTERTVAALKERNAARATLRNAGVDWIAATRAPAAPAKAAAPKPALALVTTAKAPQKPQTVAAARQDMRAAITASRGKLAEPAKPAAPAPQPAAKVDHAAGWSKAAAHVNAIRGMGSAPAPQPFAGQTGWAKAAAAVNERRGL